MGETAKAEPEHPDAQKRKEVTPAVGGASAEEGQNAKKPKKNKKNKKKNAIMVETKDKIKDIYGERAVAGFHMTTGEVQPLLKHEIKLPDTRDLIMWLNTDAVVAPKWVCVQRKPLVEKTLLLVVDALGNMEFQRCKEHFTRIQDIFGGNTVPTRCGGTDKHVSAPWPTLMAVTLQESKKDRQQRKDRQKNQAILPEKLPKIDHYLMTEEDLVGNEYPVQGHLDASEPFAADFVATESKDAAGDDSDSDKDSDSDSDEEEGNAKKSKKKKDKKDKKDKKKDKSSKAKPAPLPFHKVVAMDCEMCQTADGLALTRVSLIDRQGKVLLNELVMPEQPITDYVTRYSGITAEILQGVTTTWREARDKVMALVKKETILVGHSLENDLRALRLLHGRVIDTTKLFPHPRGPPLKQGLRRLAQVYLNTNIQQETHDSIEDAHTTMKLVNLKVERGESFGVPDVAPNEKIFKVMSDQGRRVALLDSKTTDLLPYAVGNTTVHNTQGDADMVDKASKELNKDTNNLVVGHLRGLEKHYGDVAYGRAEYSDENYHRVLQTLDAQVGEIYDAAPPNTAVILLGPQGNYFEFRSKQQQQQMELAASSGKTEEPVTRVRFFDQALQKMEGSIEQQLKQVVDTTRLGITMLAVKGFPDSE